MRVIKQLIEVLLHRGRLTRDEVDSLRHMGLVEPLPDLATLLGTDIDDLDLTVRAYNLLRREGVCTVGDLVNLTESDLLSFRNSQPKCVGEVQCKLQVIGLSLRSERDPGDVIGDDAADVWDAHADGLFGNTRRRRGGRRESRRIARARRRAAIGRIHNG